MKNLIIVLFLFFGTTFFFSFNVHAQKNKAVDLGEYILDTLGISISEKSNPNAAKDKANNGWVAYWNVPLIIFEFSSKSATTAELLKYVRNKKNYKKISDVLGYNFFLIAVDTKSLFAVKVNGGEVTYEVIPNTKENESMFFFNDQHYLKKKL